jgi:K+-sensing histidine kinase KdpD
MKGNADRLFHLGLWPIAAILVSVVLMPLRELTVASNFTFAFVALTILAGELGGRGPALASALASALSLDFFLTRPTCASRSTPRTT